MESEKVAADESSDADVAAPAAREERAAKTSRPKKRREGRRVEPQATGASSLVAVVIALAAGGVGAAAGWFGHDAQAKAKLRAESAAPAPAGSGAPSGPCGAWQAKLCAGNDASAACAEAKAAVDLLTPSTCEAALAALPATLAKVKAARVPCDTLIGKLCGDLTPGSQTCAMVKERTPSFPAERCSEMLAHYDDVIASLKQMDQQGGAHMNAPAGGPPGMAQPPGAP